MKKNQEIPKPIVIDGEIKSRILDMIGVANVKTMFLWNNRIDPDLHVNDYISFENPLLKKTKKMPDELVVALEPSKRLEFKWLMNDRHLWELKEEKAKKTKFHDVVNGSSGDYYFIGRGAYVNDEKAYHGIHIVLHPSEPPIQGPIEDAVPYEFNRLKACVEGHA